MRRPWAAGGQDNGAPGPRPIYHSHYYGAFVYDPDGNNVDAVCHQPVANGGRVGGGDDVGLVQMGGAQCALERGGLVGDVPATCPFQRRVLVGLVALGPR